MAHRVIRVPSYCPVRDPDLECAISRCDCLDTAGTPEVEGSSGICIGRIPKHKMIVDGYEHTNGYAICLYNPNAYDKEFYVCMHIINRQDMELLHGLLHSAIATRGFVKDNKVKATIR